MNAIDIVKTAVTALDEDICVIKISELTPIADYFVLVSANNHQQMDALTDAVEEALAKEGVHEKRIEGAGGESWVLMDYVDVVIHIFSVKDRDFYHLEKIWQDGEFHTAEEFLQ